MDKFSRRVRASILPVAVNNRTARRVHVERKVSRKEDKEDSNSKEDFKKKSDKISKKNHTRLKFDPWRSGLISLDYSIH